MLCFDILNIINNYLPFPDCINFKLVNKYFYDVKISFRSAIAKKINETYGFDSNHDFAKGLLDIIDKYKEFSIGGSIIPQVINNEKYNNSDIDIYFDISNYTHNDSFKIKEALGHEYFCSHTSFVDVNGKCKRIKYPENENMNNPYIELYNYLIKYEFYDKCGLHYSYRMKNWHNKYFYNGSKKIDLVFMPYSSDYRVTKLKELTCCNNYYNGKTLYIQNLDSILNKWAKYDFYEDVYENLRSEMCETKLDSIMDRCNKYYFRGYKIYIDIKLITRFSKALGTQNNIELGEFEDYFLLKTDSYNPETFYLYKNEQDSTYVRYDYPNGHIKKYNIVDQKNNIEHFDINELGVLLVDYLSNPSI